MLRKDAGEDGRIRAQPHLEKPEGVCEGSWPPPPKLFLNGDGVLNLVENQVVPSQVTDLYMAILIKFH